MKRSTRKNGGSGRGRGRGRGKGTQRSQVPRSQVPVSSNAVAEAVLAAAEAPAAARVPVANKPKKEFVFKASAQEWKPSATPVVAASAASAVAAVPPVAASPYNKMLSNMFSALTLSLTPKQQALIKLNNLKTTADRLNIYKATQRNYIFNPYLDVIGLDCEMIETKTDPMALASVSIIRYNGASDVFYIYYPHEDVKKYKFEFSGITKEKLESEGLPFEVVQNYIKSELFGKRIVGHGLDNDFKALKINVSDSNIWDTTRILHFMSYKRREIGKNNNGKTIYENILNARGNKIPLPRRLQHLAKEMLHRNIQLKVNAAGAPKGHNAVEDALASLDLYKWAEANKPDTVPALNNTKLEIITDAVEY